MRIAHIVDGFPAVTETFILRQITGSLDRGHEVDIYSLHRPDLKVVHPAVTHYSLLDRTYYLDDGRPASPARRAVGGLGRSAVYALRSPRAALHALSSAWTYRAQLLSAPYYLGKLLGWRRRQYDIVHCQYGQLGLLMGYAADMWRGKLVVSFRGYDFSKLPKIYGADMYRQLFRRADAVTATSEFGRHQVIGLGCDAGKVHRVYSPTPVCDFAFKERRLAPAQRVTLISVGRLVPHKGQEWAIRAVADVVTRHPNVVYHIIGDGPDRGRLEALVQGLNLGHVVRFLGPATTQRVAEALGEADIFLMPSTQEPLGNAAVEALASGLPVIASDVGGLPEIVIDGVTGYLVPPGDASAIAQKLFYLLDRPETWAATSRAGRSHVEATFDIKTHMDQILGVYESVCRC